MFLSGPEMILHTLCQTICFIIFRNALNHFCYSIKRFFAHCVKPFHDMYRKICIIITENYRHFFSRGLLSRRLLATLFRRRFRWSSGHRQWPRACGHRWCLRLVDMGAPPHRWGRSCAKFAVPARSSGILSSEADSPCLAMCGGGSCLKRSCTSGEVTRRVGPEENANLGDRSLDSRCAAGGTSNNRATSSLSSRLAPVKLISTSEPSLIVTLMRSGRRFCLLLGSCNLPRSSRSRDVAIAAEACQQRTN